MRLYNTPHRALEEFVPINNSGVTLYTCGPTVYSEPHIGNWISFLRWDLLVRVLQQNDYTVHRVMNITDVGHLTSDQDEGEDKIQKGARQEGISEWEVAEKYTKAFLEGMLALGMIMPEHITKATEHIDIQIELLKKIESRGHTYMLEDGLYFDTSTFPKYAEFAKLDLSNIKAGARVAFNTEKRNTSDFVLWRLTPQYQHRAMEWESPWGKGIPGWHLECSAMALHYLGETIDIHTGGVDHIPVHHTNEIAQSESATGQPFVKYWLHNAHLLSDGTKLSKSLQNSYTLKDIDARGYSPMDLRMFALQSHYRTETNFSWQNLDAAHNRLMSWRRAACLRWQLDDICRSFDEGTGNNTIAMGIQQANEALQDDLNSPEALVAIEQIFERVHTTVSEHKKVDSRQFGDLIDWVDNNLGLHLAAHTPNISAESRTRITERADAKSHGDYERADAIRAQLEQESIYLDDTPYGTVWYSTK